MNNDILNLTLWLYEQKDKVEDKLFGTNGEDRATNSTYRIELYAKLNTYDKVIRYIKNGEE